MTNDGLKGAKGKTHGLKWGKSSGGWEQDTLRKESNSELKEKKEGLFEM